MILMIFENYREFLIKQGFKHFLIIPDRKLGKVKIYTNHYFFFNKRLIKKIEIIKPAGIVVEIIKPFFISFLNLKFEKIINYLKDKINDKTSF